MEPIFDVTFFEEYIRPYIGIGLGFRVLLFLIILLIFPPLVRLLDLAGDRMYMKWRVEREEFRKVYPYRSITEKIKDFFKKVGMKK